MLEPLPLEAFGPYWFGKFAAIMLVGDYSSTEEVGKLGDTDWSKICLGTFYVKPNYPGRSSHVCNAGFLVTEASRNRGVGKLMGKIYLEWAPKLVGIPGNISCVFWFICRTIKILILIGLLLLRIQSSI